MLSEGHARCLLIAGTFPPVIGGSSFVYENLARRSAGNIVVLTSYLDHRTGMEHPGWREQDAQRPYPVHRIALVRPPLAEAAQRAGWGRVGLLGLARALIGAVRTLVRKHGIGVVCVADDETVGWLIPFAKYALRRSALIYCHGDDLAQLERGGQRCLWFGAADRIVAASRFASEQLVNNFSVRPDKIALIVNGVDCEHFRPSEPAPGLQTRYGTHGKRVILTVSRLVARKGIDRTLDALALLLPRYPNLFYLIVGDGQLRQELEEKSNRLGLRHAVRFAGILPHEDMPAHYALCEVFALPNRAAPGDEDGLPLVLLEANACAKPVIGGLAGGTAEAIQDGVNGLLVDGNDAAAIAAALDRVLSDKGFKERLIAGATGIAKQWDWDSRALAFGELCDALAGRSRK